MLEGIHYCMGAMKMAQTAVLPQPSIQLSSVACSLFSSWNGCEATVEAPATTRTLLRWEDEVSIEVSYGTRERSANLEGIMVQGRVSRVESTQSGYRLTIRFAPNDLHMKRLRRHMAADQSPADLRLVN